MVRSQNSSIGMQDMADDLLDCSLPEGQCDVLRTVKKVILALDITMFVITMSCIIILKKWKYFNQRILCHMLLANFLSAIIGLSNDALPGSEKTASCVAQAYFGQLTDLCKFLWVCALTVYLYYRLVKDIDTIKYEWLYVLTCWGGSILIALLPLTTDDYGHANIPVCWIKGTDTGNVWRLVIYWIPVFAGLFTVMIIFAYMYWRTTKVNTIPTHDPNPTTHRILVQKYLKPLLAYAASLLALSIPQLASRIQNLYAPPLFGLLAIHVVCFYSYSLVLGVLFFVSNGKKSFTPDKFKTGFHYYKHMLVNKKIFRAELIKEFEVERNAEDGNEHDYQRGCHNIAHF